MKLRLGLLKISLIIAITIFASATIFSATPFAQDYGDAVKGAILVQQICGTCHGVARGAPSPNDLAPNFSDVANTKGISGTALNVALLTPHHNMPNLILDEQQRADVIDFILGLKITK